MVIYKTINLVNNKIYIGQDINNNPKYLGSGKIFKRALKKYGIKNFKKEILECCINKEQLNEKEIFWIKKLKSTDEKIGYNISFGGEASMFNKRHSLESVNKISNNRKGKGIGRIPWNKGLRKENYPIEIIEKINKNDFNSRLYLIISPENEKIVVRGLEKFSKEHNFNSYTIRYHLNTGVIKITENKIKNHSYNTIGLNGWEIKEIKERKLTKKNKRKISLSHLGLPKSLETRKKIGEVLKNRCSGENNINAKTFYLISPQNEIFEVKGQLPTFCKEHSLNVNVLRNWVNKGKIPSTCKNKTNLIRENTNGWEIRTSINAEIKNTRGYYILTSPEGMQYKLYNGLEKFCRENNLCYGTMLDNINKGKVKQPIFKFAPERLNTVEWEIIRIG